MKSPFILLDSLLNIEGSGGGDVPYLGYVKSKLQIPGIKKFNKYVLMLVLPDSPYGKSVPIHVGSTQIDMALKLIIPGKRKTLDKSWQQGRLATLLSNRKIVLKLGV